MQVSKHQRSPSDASVAAPSRAEAEELAKAFKALGDPHRVAILQILRSACGGECSVPEEGSTVSEIACCFDLALSTISHHLKELRNAGLVECVKRGQWVHCSVNEEKLQQLVRFATG